MPQAPEPFAAGPGAHLFQLPPLAEFGRDAGGSCPSRRDRWVRAARAFVVLLAVSGAS